MCKVFYYKKADFSPQTGVLALDYAVDEIHFSEEFIFPGAPFVLSDKKKQALDQIFSLLHVAAGISYYKAFLPPQLIFERKGLTQEQARFFDRFYLQGLGEFAVRNKLNLQGKINFPTNPDIKTTAISLKLPYNAFIPVGGGKDSCVTMELIKQSDLPATVISVGQARPITDCMELSDLDGIFITRRMDADLIRLNQTGNVYNGHVPITGILAFVLWAAAVLYDKRFVIMSCERSANVGNLKQGDLPINHQYSKSFEFEQDFYELTRQITPDFRYFSLLRPLSEAHIAKLFSEKCSRYFQSFTSCNKAFKLDKTKRLDRWCGCCDKCRFVFLILAPFIERNTLIRLVGKNPLDDMEQETGFRELLGLSGHKPFECVGETAESHWAFCQLAQNPDWQEDVLVRKLKDEISQTPVDLIFTPSSTHLIPEELADVLDEFR